MRRPGSSRLGLGVAVLLVHLLLLWAAVNWVAPPRTRPGVRDTAVRVTLRAIAPALPNASPPRPTPPHRASQRPHAAPPAPKHTAHPAAEAPPVAGAELRVLPAPEPASAPPLDLRLPRPRPGGAVAATRSHSLEDPRSNGKAQRLADAPDVQFAEQSMGPGRTRIVIQGRCYESHTARAAQLDPYSIRGRTMQQVKRCE